MLQDRDIDYNRMLYRMENGAREWSNFDNQNRVEIRLSLYIYVI